jgi:hypothetical protein
MITQALNNDRTPSAPAPTPALLTDPTNISTSNRRPGTARVPITSIPPEVSIPWDIWGPKSTRWFEECLSTDWQHAIYGLRTVESVNLTGNNVFPPMPGTGPGSDPSNGMDDGVDGPFYADVGVQVDEASAPFAAASAVPSTSQGIFQAPSGAHTPSSGNGSSSANPPINNNNNPNTNNNGGNGGNQRRYLRIRDFNPYSFTPTAEAFGGSERRTHTTKGKGKQTTRWNVPRLVTAASTTPVKGVFVHDIVSSLPYMEVISRDTFEVTDVMMDDARLLLLKVRPFPFYSCSVPLRRLFVLALCVWSFCIF